VCRQKQRRTKLLGIRWSKTLLLKGDGDRFQQQKKADEMRRRSKKRGRSDCALKNHLLRPIPGTETARNEGKNMTATKRKNTGSGWEQKKRTGNGVKEHREEHTRER